MSNKIMPILAQATGGKSYKAHKYSLEHAEIPYIDYGEDTIVWERTAETEPKKNYVPLYDLSLNLIRNDVNRFSYFLDGSRHVYKVDDIAFKKPGGRTAIYPIVAGQIGVGCCRRCGKKLIRESFEYECDISVPDIADSDGINGFFPATVKKLNECDDVQRLNISFKKIIPYKTANVDQKKYEDKGTARIQDRMIELEKEAVAALVRKEKLNQDNYLIKDGSLEYRPSRDEKKDGRKAMIFKNNYNWVLGVSKNFNPEICKDIHGKSNPGFIADLPLYHRTPVAMFISNDIEFAVWYVRLRDKSKTRTPFDGVVKVEKILVKDKEISNGIDSQIVDMLSACLINERMPVCYGSDLRWANHIYPIYLTEAYIKAKYVSTESFLHLF